MVVNVLTLLDKANNPTPVIESDLYRLLNDAFAENHNICYQCYGNDNFSEECFTVVTKEGTHYFTRVNNGEWCLVSTMSDDDEE